MLSTNPFLQSNNMFGISSGQIVTALILDSHFCVLTCKGDRCGPTCTYECDPVDQPDDRKASGELVLRYRAHQKSERNLQPGPDKIEGVLDSSHKVLRNQLHDAGIDGNSRKATPGAHNSVDGYGNGEPRRKWRNGHA